MKNTYSRHDIIKAYNEMKKALLEVPERKATSNGIAIMVDQKFVKKNEKQYKKTTK